MTKSVTFNHSDRTKLSEDLSLLLDGDEWTDVTFIVEEKKFKAHRNILASRCEYFRTLFVKSKQKEIPLDSKKEPFKCILRYLYTGKIQLINLTIEKLVDILHWAHQYGLRELVSGVGKHLQRMISLETIHWILNTAVLYDMKALRDKCFEFADLNAPDVISDVTFTILSDVALKELLKRDSFAAAEIDIFTAVKAWCDKRPKRKNADITKLVRWSLIPIDNLVKVVWPSGVVSSDVLLNAIKRQRSGKLRFRGVRMEDEEIPYEINTANHYIDLGCIHFINCIEMRPCELKGARIDFEGSVDSKCWNRLSATQQPSSNGKDELGKQWIFPSTAAQYIRIFDSKNLDMSSIKVMHKSSINCPPIIRRRSCCDSHFDDTQKQRKLSNV